MSWINQLEIGIWTRSFLRVDSKQFNYITFGMNSQRVEAKKTQPPE